MEAFVKKTRFFCYVLTGALLLEFLPSRALPDDNKFRVENVRAEHDQNRIVVYYDLVGQNVEEYAVTVVLQREGSDSFKYFPKNVTGDVGTGSFAGKDRKIIWDIEKEFPAGLKGEGYYFVVQAEIASSGISPLVWIGGGVVAAGVAGLLLFGKKGDQSDITPPANVGFPPEPGRPR